MERLKDINLPLNVSEYRNDFDREFDGRMETISNDKMEFEYLIESTIKALFRNL